MDFNNNGSVGGLTNLYDDLKAQNDVPKPAVAKIPFSQSPKAPIWRNKMVSERDKLKDRCYKHLLVDIYCKILPLDDEYKYGHMGQMNGDVDAMLANKGMTASQYLKSCYESTKAPLLEFVLRSVDNIGKQFLEDATDKAEDEHAKGIDAPIPEAPTDPTEDADINDQLIDVKKDTEYETFIDKLKQKTINKIVADVSKIISDKKEEQNMSFNPKPLAEVEAETESTTSIGMNWLQQRLLKEGIEDASSVTEDMLGIAIRESTLNQLDVVFEQPGTSFREFATRIRLGKGVLINESVVGTFVEAAKSTEEVDGVVKQAKKKFDETINSKLKASDVIGAQDDKNGKEGSKSPLS